MQSAQNIVSNYPISQKEYDILDKEFIKLCHKQAWILLSNNYNNNCLDEQEDIVQDLRISMIKAASYYKRQTYIENCFQILESHISDHFLYLILEELRNLWENRTRHGANRQKFGTFQENILEQLVNRCIPSNFRPNKTDSLRIDTKFKTYCKQITWNELKQKGKKITKEKFWRTGLASLSEFSHLG